MNALPNALCQYTEVQKSRAHEVVKHDVSGIGAERNQLINRKCPLPSAPRDSVNSTDNQSPLWFDRLTVPVADVIPQTHRIMFKNLKRLLL